MAALFLGSSCRPFGPEPASVEPVLGWPVPGSETVTITWPNGDVTTFEAMPTSMTPPGAAGVEPGAWVGNWRVIGPVLTVRAPWWRRWPRQWYYRLTWPLRRRALRRAAQNGGV